METISSLFIIGAVLGIWFIISFLPWVIAKKRGHPSSLAIFWCTLFFGWTGIGWIFCLIWALGSVSKPTPQHVIVNVEQRMENNPGDRNVTAAETDKAETDKAEADKAKTAKGD